MGLSALPAPSEGVLVLLSNIVVYISLFKGVVRSFLHVVGLPRAAASADDLDGVGSAHPVGESFSGRFWSRVKPVRFGENGAGAPEGQAAAAAASADCRVCLTGFEPESMVGRLPCGHLFHEACLERWLEYHHVTCPLCRSRLHPLEESSSWLWR